MLFAKGPLPADLVGTKDLTALQTLPGMSLSRRLILIFFSAALLLVVTASAILYWATLNALRSADDQVVDKRASVIIEILRSDDLNEGLLAHEINEDNQGPRQIFMRVVSAYEPIVIETEGMEKLIQASEFPDAASSPPLEPVRKTLTTADGKTYRGASVKVDFKAKGAPITAFLQVATDTTLDDAGLAVFRRILVAVLGAAIPVCAFFAWVVGAARAEASRPHHGRHTDHRRLVPRPAAAANGPAGRTSRPGGAIQFDARAPREDMARSQTLRRHDRARIAHALEPHAA